MKRVFLFNLDPGKAARIRQTALLLGLTPVEVPQEDFGLPLGTLLGEAGFAPGEAEPFSEEMLVMETLSSPLLDALRRDGTPVVLKAVITEQNRDWTPAALCRELRREHEAMRAFSKKKPAHVHKKRR